MVECQNVQMSKITNDCLTRSGTGCFIAVTIWQQRVSQRVKSPAKSEKICRKTSGGHLERVFEMTEDALQVVQCNSSDTLFLHNCFRV